MSKIICDICGTSYPETAKQCPICGCVRPGDVQRVTNEVKKDGTGYTYVKGGRFSKSNVKKRAKSNSASAAAAKAPVSKNEGNSDSKMNIGLVITAIVLLLAIIGVVLYITLRFFAPISNPGVDPNTSSAATQSGQVDLTCKGLILDTETVVLSQIGEGRLLQVEVQPEKCVDMVYYRSENPEIATVNEVGKITAVAEGTTKIIITCGEVVKECEVVCQFATTPTGATQPSTAPTAPTTPSTAPTTPVESLRLNRKDITFSYKGESWVLYSGTIAKNLITWSSDNENVVTFVDGKAVAVGSGMTEVHAEYEDQKVSCIIRCNFKESEGVGGNGGVSEDGGSAGNGGIGEDGGSTQPTTGTTEPTTGNTSGTYKVYTQWGNAVEDVTISVGEKVGLILKDEEGNAVVVSWSVSGSGCKESGGVFTGTVSGTINTVTATYNGKTYSCIIRVK